MQKIFIVGWLLLSIATNTKAQNLAFIEKEYNVQISTTEINGTLLTPNTIKKIPLVIFIPGSGPTDRNGNSGMMKNNSLKFLAEALSNQNIATYRFDKSVLTAVKKEGFKEDNIRFEDEVEEVKEMVTHFKKNKSFSKIYLMGHSEGSLVGILAAKNEVDGLISIAGAGRPIDEIIAEQIVKQAPFLKEDTVKILEELKKGKLVDEVNPYLISLFRKSVQPYLISWIKYHPQQEIHQLKIPVLIINGTKDIQVPASDAELLKAANLDADLLIIKDMNHIFKRIEGDLIENQQSYTNPDLPVMPELVTAIATFINKQQ
ncbi:MAG: alpha/beta hydrolase [Flavobacteriaceae bacterium]|nr:alpha/beta hydrolase [Flavobacteriaceae bacterium]